jgi:hypothetical protein
MFPSFCPLIILRCSPLQFPSHLRNHLRKEFGIRFRSGNPNDTDSFAALGDVSLSRDELTQDLAEEGVIALGVAGGDPGVAGKLSVGPASPLRQTRLLRGDRRTMIEELLVGELLCRDEVGMKDPLLLGSHGVQEQWLFCMSSPEKIVSIKVFG